MIALAELEDLLRGALEHPDPDENVVALLELLKGLEDEIVSNYYGRTEA